MDEQHEPEPLTPREWQVFELLRRGFEDHQIAQVLGITDPEAARHAANVIAKLEAPSRSAIAEWTPYGTEATRAPSPGIEYSRIGSLVLKAAVGAVLVIFIATVAVVGLILLNDDDSTVRAPEDGDSSATHPLIGVDHWHAAIEIEICGVKQSNMPTFPGGVHTHSDGFVHIHPQTPSEEGDGAALGRFFEYGGGLLTDETLRVPGSIDTYTEGDLCPDGSPGELQVTVNGDLQPRFPDYVPQDGDRIVVRFGSE